MQSNKLTLAFPVLLITVGAGWLLTALGVAPEVDWAWTLGLAVVGVAAFVVGGMDKVTAVVGPFFLTASGLSLARQTGRLAANLEAPLLTIVAGTLLLVARSRLIAPPKWLLVEAPTIDTP